MPSWGGMLGLAWDLPVGLRSSESRVLHTSFKKAGRPAAFSVSISLKMTAFPDYPEMFVFQNKI